MKHARAIVPVLRYRDPNAAAGWLCTALGFERVQTAADPRGRPYYISLRLGDCFVLVCPLTNAVLRNLMIQPAEAGGANTQICYLTVEDVAAHSRRAEAAGAKIVLEPQDDGAAGRFYMCRDPDGHLWSIGTRAHGTVKTSKFGSRRTFGRLVTPVAAALLTLAGWFLFEANYRGLSQTVEVEGPQHDAALDRLQASLTKERAECVQIETMVKATSERLEREQVVSATLKQELLRAQADLAAMRLAKEDADRAAMNAKAAAALAELSSKNATDAFVQERAAATAAQNSHDARVAKTAHLEAALATERELRMAAEIEVASLRERLARSERGVAGDPSGEKVAMPAAKVGPPADVDRPSAEDVPARPDEARTGRRAAPTCISAAQNRIPAGLKGPKTWDATDLARLCRGAEASIEPARCFGQLMSGKISWGGGTTWVASNAVALCAGTRSASETLDCFAKSIAQDQPWRAAIARCRTE